MGSCFKIVFVFLFTQLAQATASDCSIQVTGPKSVHRGYPMDVTLKGIVLGGTDTASMTAAITRAPAGVHTSRVRGCCSESQIWRVIYPQILVLKTHVNTALGSPSVVIPYSLPSGLTREVAFDFTTGVVPAMNLPAVLL